MDVQKILVKNQILLAIILIFHLLLSIIVYYLYPSIAYNLSFYLMHCALRWTN